MAVQQSRLLSLPAELRLMIYKYALDDPDEELIECLLGASDIWVYRGTAFVQPSHIQYCLPALAQTCKQLHNEVLQCEKSRGVLKLWVDDYRSKKYVPSYFRNLDSFRFPEYCCGRQIDIDIFLGNANDIFRKVNGDLMALARKTRMRKFGDFQITTARNINEENMCSHFRGFATMCVSYGQPKSILVEKIEGTGGFAKEERMTSDFIAAAQTVKRYGQVVRQMKEINTRSEDKTVSVATA